MAIRGDLGTMPLDELLQWVGGHHKTGVLELERNQLTKRIAFREGRIVGCSSDEPSLRLGRFLVSRGRITPRTLQYALREQKARNTSVPRLLIDMGVITKDELGVEVASKALETILGVFDWELAVFRFRADSEVRWNQIEVDLSVDEVLHDGTQRREVLQRIRRVFPSSGIVLLRTEQPLPPEVDPDAPALEVLDLIDGERPLAEILLKTHAPEMDVVKLLATAHAAGCVVISEEQVLSGCFSTLLDVGPGEDPAELPNLAEFSTSARGATEPNGGGPSADGNEADESQLKPTDLYVLLHFASGKMDEGDHETALDTLDACYRARPDDESVKRLLATAEAGYLRHVRSGPIPLDDIPVRIVADEELAIQQLQPAEAVLLGSIDGEMNVQSLLWTVPLREVQSMRTLAGLLARNLVRFEQPNADEPADRSSEAARPEVDWGAADEIDLPDLFADWGEGAHNTDRPVGDRAEVGRPGRDPVKTTG